MRYRRGVFDKYLLLPKSKLKSHAVIASISCYLRLLWVINYLRA